MDRGQPPFTVQCHDGKPGSTWRVVGTFDSEADAKPIYRDTRRGIVRGGIALCDSRGVCLMKAWKR